MTKGSIGSTGSVLGIAFCVFMALIVCSSFGAEAGDVVKLRAGVKQLFLDDFVVEKLDGVERVLNQPRKYEGNPVVRTDPRHPWEIYSIQTRDAPMWNPEAERWELLYLSDSLSSCLTVSTDGLAWMKPILGLHEVEGSKETNLLWPYDPEAERVFLYHRLYDPHDPDPQRRWKALIGERSPRPAASPDGYTWTYLSEEPIPSGEEHHLIYDELGKQYVFTLRTKDDNGRRAVSLSTSKDFVHWSEPEPIFHANERDQETGREWLKRHLADPTKRKPWINNSDQWNTQVYNMAVFPYEGVYIGLPTYFRVCGHDDEKAPASDGFSTTGLAVSRDLRNWHRISGVKPFIPLSSVAEGVYDTAQIEPPARPIRHGDELWFYYTALKYRYAPEEVRNQPDKGSLCLAKLRLDGFVSLDAGETDGTVLTKPVEWHGSRLFVNAAVKGGAVHVEILDEAGNPLDGYGKAQSIPVTGDAVQLRVYWQGEPDLGALEGRTVRVRFHLNRVKLHAFWAE